RQMKHHLLLSLSVLAATGGQVLAQEKDIQPETLAVEARISEGNHIYLMDMGISGSSSVFVLNADDLSLEGNIGAGTFSQMLMSGDGKSIYTGSVYMKRYTRGPIEAVIEEYDPQTLLLRREFTVSGKMAQTLSQKGALNLSADGKYMLVQNATPATSINVVDLAAGKDLVEVPTPGC
ncbi:amine dehydrogenase large subunit, partial [Pseudonocardia halophobica]|uniref:amine dehydrogenase large subunit n=1 Tax=Pseudonocardia halophobica TaxID=29401 RepID=UPI0022F31684